MWDLKVIPLDSPVAEPSKHDPELENAYICHLQNHWFCIRKVNGEWYNFNSLYAAPEHLTRFYLSAYLDTLKSSGWSIFLVRGNFPKDCPVSSSDPSYGFGQWLTPDDAKGITNSCNESGVTQRIESPGPNNPVQNAIGDSFRSNFLSHEEQNDDEFRSMFASENDIVSQQEQNDLAAAIQASLMDSVDFGQASKEMGDESLPDKNRTSVPAEASSQIPKNNEEQPDSISEKREE